MSSFYEKEKGYRLVSQLIWTWYDNTYFSNQDDQLDMVSTVESSVEHLQTKCILNLSVPDHVPLLSSYSKWNRLMEYCATFDQTPSCHQDLVGIFDLSHIQNHDYIQAVLPMIKRSWIISVEEINLDRFLSRWFLKAVKSDRDLTGAKKRPARSSTRWYQKSPMKRPNNGWADEPNKTAICPQNRRHLQIRFSCV